MKTTTKISLFLALISTACETNQEQAQYAANKYLKTVVIDGCEYLYDIGSNGREVLTHKGNCKNPTHQPCKH